MMDDLFFIASKLVWALLSPLNVIILLSSFTALLLWFDKVAIAKKVALLLLVINVPLLVYPVGDILIYPLEQRFPQPQVMPKDVDGIIVLGGAEDLKSLSAGIGLKCRVLQIVIWRLQN